MNNIEVYEDLFLTVPANNAMIALTETGRSSQVVWKGEVPPLPIKAAGWELSRTRVEDLPIEAQRRVNIIKRNGVPIKDILIAHELPPVHLPEPRRGPSLPKLDLRTWSVTKIAIAVAIVCVVGLVLLMAATLAFLMVAPLLIPIGAVLLAPFLAIHDPAVIVVLEDDTWLQVAFWYE